MITENNLMIAELDSVIKIIECNLEVRPNCHASCFIRCLLSEEIPCNLLNGQILSVVYQVDGIREILFKGVLQYFVEKRAGDYLEANLTVASASIELDYAKHTRPFQDTGQSYESVVRHILWEHPGADVLFMTEQKEKQSIQDLLLQYRESDWEFFKRIAGHLTSTLIPDIRTGQPKFYCGFPDAGEMDEECLAYQISIDKRYYESNHLLYAKDQFVCYHANSGSYYPVGTPTVIEGRRVYILSIHAKLTRGILVFTYELGQPILYNTVKYDNHELIGASLTATVIESNVGTVKVAFDIDPNEANIQKPYPWTPTMGNLFSCMPEPGEQVAILFKSADETQAVATERYRRNDITDCRNITSSADRYFTTDAGKELRLVPDSIGLDNHTGNSLSLDDKAGIGFQGKIVELEAKGKILLKGNRIYAFAPLQSTILKGGKGGSINICQNFNTFGEITFLAQASPYDQEEPERLQGSVDISGVEQQVIAMIPAGRCEDPLVHQALGMLIQ